MKRLLVTGASGFLGRHVIQRLGRSPYEVHAVAFSTQPDFEGANRCTWHRANLLDEAERSALVAATRPHALLHLAWHAKPPSYWRATENIDWLTASLELFRSVARSGATRLVGAGSCMEYDWDHGCCIERTTPLRPATLYGTAKAACGNLLEALGGELQVSAAWGRVFFVFGPHDSPLRLVPSLVQAIATGRAAHCKAGSHVRDFMHVGDVASAFVALLESNVCGAVNIASGVPLRISDVARQIADVLRRPELLTIDEGPSEHRIVCADVSRLRQEVDWRPERDIRERLDDTIAWWASSSAPQVSA